MTKRAKSGDILEVAIPNGLIYLHFMGTHPEYGDGVMVCPTQFPQPVAASEDLFHNGYMVFYPARAAVSRGLARIVGQSPSRGIPSRLRRPGARLGRRVETWIIEENSTEEVKRELSDEDLRLPLAVIFNHELLIQRVLEGWRPEKEGRALDDA